jgi:hypothetical protein
MEFNAGQTYTRQQIAEAVGGGSTQDFLPNKDGKVLCACLSQEFDPADPVVLVGRGPGVEMQAEMFCRQNTPVPVFYKKQANQWAYAGTYAPGQCSRDPCMIGKYEESSGRTSLTSVIFLEKGGDR